MAATTVFRTAAFAAPQASIIRSPNQNSLVKLVRLPLSTRRQTCPNTCLKFHSPRLSKKLSTNSSFVLDFTCFASSGETTETQQVEEEIEIQDSQFEFSDGSSEVELRLVLGDRDLQSTKDIFVDANENFLTVRVQCSGTPKTLIETGLYEKIKPSETIWYLDDTELVINLKKQDPDLKWPDIMESWESLSVGVSQLLKATSIYLVGDSTEINQKIARELAVGLGYTPLDTKELLESFTKQDIDSLLIAEGSEAVADAEGIILESLSSHVRAVVATLGGKNGAARRFDKWRHLYAGFVVWLSQSEAKDENSAKEEVRTNIQEGSQAYSNADVVVKIGGWDADYTKNVAQASLSALKSLILSDKKLPGKKGLYIRLGCRGDWPNINPPGWDPSSGVDPPTI